MLDFAFYAAMVVLAGCFGITVVITLWVIGNMIDDWINSVDDDYRRCEPLDIELPRTVVPDPVPVPVEVVAEDQLPTVVAEPVPVEPEPEPVAEMTPEDTIRPAPVVEVDAEPKKKRKAKRKK